MVDVLCYYIYHGRCLYCVTTCMYSIYIMVDVPLLCTVLVVLLYILSWQMCPYSVFCYYIYHGRCDYACMMYMSLLCAMLLCHMQYVNSKAPLTVPYYL